METDSVPVGGTGDIVFAKSSVASAETASFTVVVKVNLPPPVVTTITDTATVSTTDPNTNDSGGNNSQTATTTVATLDFGDAPDPTYPTLLASNGARHTILPVNNPTLGPTEDAEADGQPNATATGDGSDEDGVTFLTSLLANPTAGTMASVTVNVTGAVGKLDAFVDFNRDGDWTDPGEEVFTDVPLALGNNTLSITSSGRCGPATPMRGSA